MKKTILALAILLMTITAFAQESKETSIRVPSGYTGFLETGLGGVWTQYGVDGYFTRYQQRTAIISMTSSSPVLVSDMKSASSTLLNSYHFTVRFAM